MKLSLSFPSPPVMGVRCGTRISLGQWLYTWNYHAKVWKYYLFREGDLNDFFGGLQPFYQDESLYREDDYNSPEYWYLNGEEPEPDEWEYSDRYECEQYPDYDWAEEVLEPIG